MASEPTNEASGATANDMEVDVSTTPPADEVADNDEEKTGDRPKRRRHGRGFVYLGLKDAEKAVRKIDHHAKRMSKDGFARALGHKKAEGRFFGKLDALQTYQLVEANGDEVVLTPLAIDMLYGASDDARAKARVTAFLACDEFSKTFAECPKGQNHPVEYIVDYVKGKLGIVNEIVRFKRLFLASAHFAGLLEGELNTSAKEVRFRHATPQAVVASAKPRSTPERTSETGFETIDDDQAAELLDSFGLGDFTERAEVARSLSGKVTQQYAEGALTLEINQPFRIVIRQTDLLTDLPTIVTAMRQKGLSI